MPLVLLSTTSMEIAALESITVKVTHAGQTRRNTFKRCDFNYEVLREWILASFGVALDPLVTRLSYKDPESDVISIGSNAELGEAVRLTNHPEILGLTLSFPRPRERGNRFGPENSAAEQTAASESPTTAETSPSDMTGRWARRAAWRAARQASVESNETSEAAQVQATADTSDAPARWAQKPAWRAARQAQSGQASLAEASDPSAATIRRPRPQWTSQSEANQASATLDALMASMRQSSQHEDAVKRNLKHLMVLNSITLGILLTGWLRPIFAVLVVVSTLCLAWKTKKLHSTGLKLKKQEVKKFQKANSAVPSAPQAPPPQRPAFLAVRPLPAFVPVVAPAPIAAAAPRSEPIRPRERFWAKHSAKAEIVPKSDDSPKSEDAPTSGDAAQPEVAAKTLGSSSVVVTPPVVPAEVENLDEDLNKLVEMGFTDPVRNKQLLSRTRSLEKTVHLLLLQRARAARLAEKV